MARPTVSDLSALGDFTQSFRWQLALAGTAPAAVAFPTTNIDFLVETATLPKATGTTVDVTIHGSTTRQPGIYKKYGTLTFTFAELVDNSITAWLSLWQKALWATNIGTRIEKSLLVADFTLTRLDNADTPIWQYYLYNCFLEDSEPGALTQNSADPIRPSLMLSYDDFDQGPVSASTPSMNTTIGK